jgi:putative MATE family efflux protein
MQATFTQGSIFKHVCVMTFTSTAGLLSLFLVDLVDLYWLSLLGEIELAAAIGYAGSILFFTLSLCIGLSIGCSALVSQSVGAGNVENTRQLIGHIFIGIAVITALVAIPALSLLSWLLESLGASGRAHDLAQAYMTIILPSLPLMGIAMASSGVMRALGHAKEAMYLTLLGGFVNALLDPLFIFGFGLGIEGAAIATVCARIAMISYGLHRVYYGYGLLVKPHWQGLIRDISDYSRTAFPAVLTNLSTPIGVAFITATMAQFGDSAVAGNAIISKLQPLAFAGLFALSGSIGPIAGQNLGAKQFDRILRTLRDSLLFTFAYGAVACLVLLALTDWIILAFNAEGQAATLIRVFCYGLSLTSLFNGMTFVSNALFNNLRIAAWATGFNFAKATLFTMPFASVGGHLGGPVGVYWGVFFGAAIIGVAGTGTAYWKIKRLEAASQHELGQY